MLQKLPELAYQILVERHLSELEVKTVRLVSKVCKSSTDTILTALKPKDIANCEVTLIATLPLEKSSAPARQVWQPGF